MTDKDRADAIAQKAFDDAADDTASSAYSRNEKRKAKAGTPYGGFTTYLQTKVRKTQ